MTYAEDNERQKKEYRQEIRDALELLRCGSWKTPREFHDAIYLLDCHLRRDMETTDRIDDTIKPDHTGCCVHIRNPNTDNPLCGETSGGYYLTNDFATSNCDECKEFIDDPFLEA